MAKSVAKKVDWSQVEERVLKACAKAKDLGVTIAPGSFGMYRRGGVCCPITAVLGPEQPCGDNVAAGAQALGLSTRQVWDFVYGFDANRVRDPQIRPGSTGYRLGRRVRAKVLGL